METTKRNTLGSAASVRRMFRASRRLRLLIAGIAMLAAVMLIVAAVEWGESRDELLLSLKSEAATLVETLNRSSETIAEASEQIEDLLMSRLSASARLAAHLEEHSPLNDLTLARMAKESGVELLSVADGEGRILSASSGGAGAVISPELQDNFKPVARGEYIWLALGVAEYPGLGQLLLVAHERRHGKGVIIAGIDAGTLLEFRKRTGIGRLIRDLGRNPNLAFVAIQDVDGIISASEGVEELTGIPDDHFLINALNSDTACTRILDMDRGKVLEVVRRLDIPDHQPALTRMGLSLENVRAIQQRAMRRILFIALGVLIAGGFMLGFLLTRQRFGVLQEEHRRVLTSTELVLENIAEAVVATDASGIVTVFNMEAERLFRRSADATIGQACRTVFPDDTLLLCKSLTDGPTDYAEREIGFDDGAYVVLAVSTSIIRSETNIPDTVISVARDLTDERRMREQLRRREQLSAMGSLASGIAHEIRNPLNAISVIAQRFRLEFSPREDADEFFALADTVRGEVRRVNSIVTQFLAFAKPSPVQPAPNDLGGSVRAALRIIDSQAREASVGVEFVESEKATVDIDEEKWTQALLNLFQNAIEAMDGGGKLHCRQKVERGRAVIEISDTGSGIAKENLPRIFNMYFSTKQTGTGLGLSLVHQIINEHGGTIDAHSDEGRGSTFVITIPLSPSQAGEGKTA